MKAMLNRLVLNIKALRLRALPKDSEGNIPVVTQRIKPRNEAEPNPINRQVSSQPLTVYAGNKKSSEVEGDNCTEILITLV